MKIAEYSKAIDNAMKKLDSVLGELDYLQACIGDEIEALTELRGETNERAEKVAQALDLNRKAFESGIALERWKIKKEKENELSGSKTD